MKTTLFISLICLASIASYAQAQPATAVCKRDADMPKGAVATWPVSPYVSTQGPGCAPCYTYTRKSGLVIMECPFLIFMPDQQTADKETITFGWEHPTGDVKNEPKVCKRDPDMPANATPAWPSSPYVATQAPECAPCYTYVSQHGVEIMECPYLRFLPEDGK